jgi:hypothetical protein
MGEVLAFAPRPPAGDWTASERGLLLLLTQHLEKSYGEVDAVFGQTDSGDPWYVVTDANQDVLVHVARIEGQFVVHDAAVDMFHQVGSLWSALRQMLASGAPEATTGVVVAFNPASREAQSLLSLIIAVGLYLELHEAGFGAIADLDFESLPRNGDLAVDGVASKLIAALNLEGERVGAHAAPPTLPANENAAASPTKSEAGKASAIETPWAALAGLTVTKATQAQAVAPAMPSSEPPAPIRQQATSTAEEAGGTQGFAGTKSAINGTAGNDNMVGSVDGEVIRAGAGDDRIDGGGARSGVDRIDGGAGNDRIVMSARVVASGGEGGDTFLISANTPASKAEALLGVVLDYAAAKGDHLAVLGKGQLTVVNTTAVSDVLAAQEAALGEATAHLVTDVAQAVGGARVGFDIDGDGREDVYILLGGATTATFVIGTTIESHAAAPTLGVTLVGQSTTDVSVFGEIPAR